MINKKILSEIKEYVMISLGMFLFVLGWSVFLVPNNLLGGGVSGISALIQYATQGAIKIGTSYFVINVGLLIVALFTLGKSFGGKTFYAVVIASLGLNLAQQLIPEEIITVLAIDNGKLLSTIMGGLLVGVGIGMAMENGGSTGGTDIIALIINKYRGISPGRMLMFIDVLIILSSFFVPSYTSEGLLMPWTDKVTTAVYAFILVGVTSTAIDQYISGSRQSVQLFIFSPKYEQIANVITHDLNKGVTVLNGKGWYSGNDTQVIMVIARKSDLRILLRCVKSIDPDAFLSVSHVTGVYGKGFDKIKIKTK